MTPTLRPTKTGWSARVRMGQVAGKSHRPWLPMPAMKAGDAEDRRDRLQRLAEEFVRAGKSAEADRALRICAEQPTGKAFEVAERAARRALAETGAPPAGPRTFRDVAELWTSGRLHREHHDAVTAKGARTRKQDAQMLALFYPLLGKRPIREITTAEVKKARALVSSDYAPNTRRVYLTRLRMVFTLACDVLELMPVSPVPKNFVPKMQSTSEQFSYLYPDEEAAFSGCTELPIELRFLYAFLFRNGTRIVETLHLTWDHVDLERGTVRLEAEWTKTRQARQWKLAPDVLAAFRARHAREGKPQGATHVFRDETGAVYKHNTIWRRFRSDLERAIAAAGLRRRPELFDRVEGQRPFRIHDTRGTFVTLARRVGHPDRWIMDRTGHETLGVLGGYERLVRAADELDHGWFMPMDALLLSKTETAGVDQGLDQRSPKPMKELQEQDSITKYSASARIVREPNSAAASRSVDTKRPFGPPSEGGVDQKLGTGVTADVTSPGLSEDTLRRLLDLATRSREWGVVRELSVALEGLEQRRAPNVTRLDSARSKRGDR